MRFTEIGPEQERLVLRTAYRLTGRWEESQDIAQEVFLKLLRSGERFDSGRALGPWLYRITVNACRDRYRRQRATAELVDLPDEALSPEELASLDQQRRMLHVALGELPERERQAIVLRELEGYETHEVAAILGSTEATVRSQISMGRARLRRILTAAMAASLGLVVWMLWPGGRPEVQTERPNQMATDARPASPPQSQPPARKAPTVASVVPAARPPKPQSPKVRRTEQTLVKLETADPDVVIYWIVETPIVETKGENE